MRTRLLYFLCCATLMAVALTTPATATASDWFAEAKEAMAEHRWKQAIKILDTVLEQEPDLLKARRLRAICHREEARIIFYNRSRAFYYLSESDLRRTWRAAQQQALGKKATLKRGRDYPVTRAIFDFEHILARDSSFLDVLAQYAQLWREHLVLTKALTLGEAQIRLKPDLAQAHVELTRTYRHYIARTRPEKAFRWLREHATPYAEYFTAEIHRKENLVGGADRIFAQLLAGPMRIPRQPVLLSRARIAISRGHFEEGYQFIEDALHVHTETEARLVFEDFNYVLTEEEYHTFQFLQTPAQYTAFFRTMWTRRDPMPASRINWRLVEHYRRLIVAERDYAYFGERTWFNNPDEGKQLDFPDVAALNHAFNDKGLVYIRHGEPDERVTSQREHLPANVSWQYRAEGLDFHFVVATTGHNWRLAAVLTDCFMLDDRRHWGGYYSKLAGRISPAGPCAIPPNEFDRLEGEYEMAEASRAFVLRGLTTDRHTWTDAIESFDFPFDLVAFRGSNGQTDLRLYYALPIAQFSKASSRDTLRVEVGIALHDTVWTPVVDEASILQFLSTDAHAASAIREMRLSVPPDSYHVALHSDLLDTPLLGGYRFDRRIPDFSRPELMMSDVVLAYAIRPQTDQEPTRRDALQIVPNPFHRFALDQSLHIYFELYHLTLDAEERARYRVEYVLEPEKTGGGLLGLNRRKEPSLSVTTRFESTTPSPLVFSEIDVREVAAGSYGLVVRVTDIQTGQETTQRVPVALYRR